MQKCMEKALSDCETFVSFFFGISFARIAQRNWHVWNAHGQLKIHLKWIETNLGDTLFCYYWRIRIPQWIQANACIENVLNTQWILTLKTKKMDRRREVEMILLTGIYLPFIRWMHLANLQFLNASDVTIFRMLRSGAVSWSWINRMRAHRLRRMSLLLFSVVHHATRF